MNKRIFITLALTLASWGFSHLAYGHHFSNDREHNSYPTVTARGKLIKLSGNLPKIGKQAPDATLADANLNNVTINQYRGQILILNIFPSLDTPTCSASVHHFNSIATKIHGVHVLCISMDLPFASRRFCATEGLKNITALSGFRSDFWKKYGVKIEDGPMKGLYTRAVVVIDKNGRVVYTQLVPEITKEPQYEPVLDIINKLQKK